MIVVVKSGIDGVDGSSTGARAPWMWVLLGAYDSEEPDHANDYDHRSRYREVGFQVRGVDADGQLKRRYVLSFFQKLPPCLIGIEACASSHYWSRELQALGHTVRLMPPAYVKPYVNDRRTMPLSQKRFVKRSPDQTCGSWQPRRRSSRAV